VISSKEGDPYNAIDPGLFLDRDGKLWMAFGSFWQGIYLVELDARTGKRIMPHAPAIRIAHHSAIEAPALHRRGEHYYLFVNFGICCRGTNSTYEVRVGRSSKVAGPYLDRESRDMVNGGGTLFLATQADEIGPGHIGIMQGGGGELVSYHIYNRKERGRSQLRTRPLRWTADGWPELERISQ
jgi:arabinan endo-1,5-alpha-L-arabinosidase